jgi:hypothetical protein
MKTLFAFFALCALVGLIPCIEQPRAGAQYGQHIQHQGYNPQTGYYQTQPSYYQQPHYRQRVQFREIRDNVIQINPAYTQDYNSAYSPGAYDGTVQADLLRQVAELKAQYAALLAQSTANAVKIAAPQPQSQVVVIPTATPGQQPQVVVIPPHAPAVNLGPAVVQPPAVALPPAKLGPNGERPGIAVLNAKCAKCHKAGSLSAGQQFTMLDAAGQLTKDAQDPIKEKGILKRTYTQSMPPPGNIFGIPPVTDAEYAMIVDALP